ncbi:MAG: alpha-L-glutamate ligase-like protein [Calditrichaeota bacterium]|nr:alpha-L-glutamate ligase-like protein [Calditrichota bacterium]
MMEKYSAILGINERNINYVFHYNERKYYPMADDKVLTKQILQQANIPTPKLLYLYEYFYQLNHFTDDLKERSEFVVKPARSMGGGGILIFDRYEEEQWITSSDEAFNAEELYEHAAQILSGVYSLDNTGDTVMVEEKIQLHELFRDITYQGIPDIRVIVLKHHPVMAMLRIPTRMSQGRANLHAGGIGVGIDLQSGVTTTCRIHKQVLAENPDLEKKLSGLQIPDWDMILDIAGHVQDHIPLGYLGIDFVIDQRYGPQILELNVRPGLEIQNINGTGLKEALENIEENL